MDTLNKFVYVQKSGITAPASLGYGSQVVDANATSTYIQEGQIVVTDTEGHVYNTEAYNASTNPYGLGSMPAGLVPKAFNIRHRIGDAVYKSAEINVDQVENYLASPYRPALEQVGFLGYNGTDGTLTKDLSPNTTYKVTLWREDNDNYIALDRPESAFFVSPATFGSTATAATDRYDLGIELVDQIYKIFIKGVTGYKVHQLPLKVELITSNAGSGSATAAVAYENEYITVSTIGGLVVGSIFLLGGTVYKVKSIDGTKVQLTVPYQGASASAAAIKELTWAAADKLGIKVTGKVLQPDPVLWPYRKVLFNMSANEYITGSVSNYGVCAVKFDTKGYNTAAENIVTAGNLISNSRAYLGVGVAGEVQKMEYDYKGAWSKELGYLLSVDRERYRQFISTANGSACTYSYVVLNWNHPFTNPVSTANLTGTLMIAVPVTYNGAAATMTETVATAANYGFVTVLDSLLSALGAQATKLKTY